MTSILLVFDEIHGENVLRTCRGKSVSWKHSYSGGLVFSDVRLEDGDVVKLTMQGSTHADIGFTQINPEEISDLRNAIKKKQVSFVGNVGINKDTFKVRLQRKQHSIIYKYGNLQTTHTICGDLPVWIAVYLQFGKCNLKLYDKDRSAIKWHNKCGMNIQFEDVITRHKCTLVDDNPAAFACVQLHPTAANGIRMKIRIRAASEELIPYSFSVYTSILSPSCLNSSLFAIVEPLSDAGFEGLTYLKKFEYNPRKTKMCEGMLEISVFASGIATFKHNSEGSTVAKLRTNSNDKLTLLFKLCHVSIEIVEACESPPDQDIEGSSNDASSVTSDESSFVIATGSEMESSCMLSSSVFQDEPSGTAKFEELRPSDCINLPSSGKSDIVKDWVKARTGATSVQKRKRSLPETYLSTGTKDRIDNASQPPFKRVSSAPCLRLHSSSVSTTSETSETLASTEVPNVQNSIRQNYVFLVQNLQAFPLCDHLYENEILSSSEQQKVRKMERHQSSDDVNRELLDILQSKKISPTLMKNALSKSGLSHIVDIFNPKSEK
ncbi:uncharacterized protein LOC110466899 [Mizuhopecten yessoensis]|uniref:CARD domain-containing protein n=1 Tax=Mizuhopecten yessoensis TaxID=6573 RepID=A0A210PN74_MIZYE|nr:uncharacterized protein LOC110466899 [Mizuhopecten yessoensis]XP_021379365.1 uncharacterized protein LOC110466899 [Mizuhopecten yessoensis]OWF37913.1 hypothetical protein KP79_PYT22745 [Mizuhopecten yessoensis]